MDFLYPIFLTLHSILRWLVLLAALLAIIRSANGLSFKRGWTAQDNRISMWFTGLLDLQVLIGIILYFFLSPVTTAALQNFGGAMSNSDVRYFLVEHSLMMVAGAVVAHIGRSLVKRAENAAAKHRRAIIWFGLALLIVLLAIPWPFLPMGRPLLRFGG